MKYNIPRAAVRIEFKFKGTCVRARARIDVGYDVGIDRIGILYLYTHKRYIFKNI